MKSKLFLSFLFVFCMMLQGAIAQNKAYLVLEYMHVKPGNDDAYLNIENVWKRIHLQRQKDSSILNWSLWSVVAPSNMNAEYQYVVATVYRRFADYLEPYKNIDLKKIFSDISEDSLNRVFGKTGEVRDLLRSSVFEIVYDLGLGAHLPKYVLYSQMKPAPGKTGAYESLEMKDWMPIHKDLIKNGFESGFNFSRLLYPSDANAPFDYAIFRFFDTAAMFDKQDKINWDKYFKANPNAFNNAAKLRTEVHTELLTLVTSLSPDSK